MSKRSVLCCTSVTCLILSAATARGATYEELAAKARTSQELAEKAGAQLLAPATQPDEFQVSYGYEESGGVLFYPDMNDVLVDRPPTNTDVLRRPWVLVAQGETRPLVVAACTVRPAEGVSLWAQILDANDEEPHTVGVGVRPIIFAPVAQRGQKAYRMQGLWLAEPSHVQAAQDHVVAWVLRVEAGRRAEPGDYRLSYRINWQNEDPTTAPRDTLRVTVLPFQLPDPTARNYTFGAFCAGADFSETQFLQMREHGIDSILFFWGHYGLNLSNDGGKVRLDFAELDRMVARYKAAGMAGPIVIALGNDSASSLERRIAEAFNLPLVRQMREGKEVRVAPLDNPRFEELIVEALSQLFAHAKAGHWPQIVILPYDEPTERLMPEYRRMLGLFRKHFPNVRLYGVTMDRLEWAKMVSDADILSTNGDFARIITFDRQNHKTAWFYGSDAAAMGYGSCRASYGLARYVYHPDGSWFWSYNFHVGDPWNEFDGATPDSAWVICWPPLREDEPSVNTLGYEGLRAGVNDVRYAMALEDALKTAKGSQAERIRGQYEAWRQQAQQGRLRAPQAEAARLQMIEWMLQVTGRPPPRGLEAARAAASQPSATQAAGFAPIENEQD
jgi:hypothetical protein